MGIMRKRICRKWALTLILTLLVCPVDGDANGPVSESMAKTAISFHVKDTPIRAVLHMIAEESGLNLVLSDQVEGVITLRLDGIPWPKALEIVMQSHGLASRDLGGVMLIAPQAEIADYEQAREDARLALEERTEMVTEHIPLSHADAAELSRLLGGDLRTHDSDTSTPSRRHGFLSARGQLSFDKRTNALILIDTPARAAEIKRLITTLDTPVDQVAIEARIVIADDSFSREIGARFGILGSSRRVQWNGPGANLPANTATGGALGLTILGNTINWDAELTALQTEGRGEVLSNPRIITSNQKEARISQGEEIGYLTVTGGQSNTIPSVEFKEVLLEFKATPTITADGRVYLNLSLNKDELAGWVETGAGQVPRLSRREITTSVLMDDGQTLSIGGVYEFRDRKALARVPFLSRLPGLGHLFKRRGREHAKVELMVLVTPQVIRVERPDKERSVHQ